MPISESDASDAYRYFLISEYEQAASIYEASLAKDTTNLTNYWYLGLTYLLQGHEDAAQLTWLSAMDGGDDQAVGGQKAELAEVLETEAQRLETLENLQASWLIRQYLQEVTPEKVENLLRFVELGVEINADITHTLADHHLVELLQDHIPGTLDSDLLQRVLLKLSTVSVIEPLVLEILRAALPHIQKSETLTHELLETAIKLRFEAQQYTLAADLAEFCTTLDPDNLTALRHLSGFCTDALRYAQGIEVAQEFCDLCTTPEVKLLGGHLLLRALLTAGHHGSQVWAAKKYQETWLAALVAKNPTDLARGHAISLPFVTSFYAYLQDQPQVHRTWQNQVAQIAQQNLRNCAGQSGDLVQSVSVSKNNTSHSKSSKPLRIGYIAHTLRKHSVGWLSRWLFQHHDHDVCHVSLYLVSQGIDEFTNRWFVNVADACWHSRGRDAITERILTDQIDILVDLDSYTLDATAEVMALKPAPVQVTWLGADASGLPAIDYFIADPYVLPEDAQDYYQEKIWRLPQTYIAVNGFEVGVPTLRRDHLNIPADAVIYFSGQTGLKRHPDMVRLQLKILKEVPNSYFLVKSLVGDQTIIQQSFIQLAEEEGINPGRLRFLEGVADESAHRANLGIADVILDTYPYNGATTTLEALWVGVPLVTRVGQQFAARNSYAFLTNVGVTEGIAWTDEEYIDWGVRLGKDETLRQQVSWKLKASRQTSPLWNAQQFTREMEKAYQQMWQIYLESKAD
ncbi:MAG: O-linked N-acetylglucosamine transferase, SPINDLY family protein [Acaryochloris sp. RU_4_1]|nr:O-linked N-acetylglucosamine transferase, SPINDLY family protein [Acaryochloris sp. RU_4_1]NJR55893.1 O-linked N-acetylglucosamine transferase, SPINDLY family protein [Acaryochloris sp. CRU_2_0]